MPDETTIGVLLMTYGSPATLDDIPEYMTNVRGGRPPEPELVTEFRRRYELIGGSPLLRITQEQAAALEDELNRRHLDGPRFKAAAGMRFAPPYVADVLPELAAGTDQVVGIIMSPQYSPILMRGYVTAITEAAAELNRDDLRVRVAEDWHLQPDFVAAVAERVRAALDELPPDERDTTPVLLTAHSMPLRVVRDEPDYIGHLHETAAAVARAAGLGDEQWQFCYQSAGHTPEEWLKPDFADLMPELRKQGKRAVLIAPIQFLADHLEILYDIEIGAREQAESNGIAFHRTASLNTAPRFIAALAAVVEDVLAREQAAVPGAAL